MPGVLFHQAPSTLIFVLNRASAALTPAESITVICHQDPSVRVVTGQCLPLQITVRILLLLLTQIHSPLYMLLQQDHREAL